jgi:hypothetical protein
LHRSRKEARLQSMFVDADATGVAGGAIRESTIDVC